jgi:hypothetical protein
MIYDKWKVKVLYEKLYQVLLNLIKMDGGSRTVDMMFW